METTDSDQQRGGGLQRRGRRRKEVMEMEGEWQQKWERMGGEEEEKG